MVNLETPEPEDLLVDRESLLLFHPQLLHLDVANVLEDRLDNRVHQEPLDSLETKDRRDQQETVETQEGRGLLDHLEPPEPLGALGNLDRKDKKETMVPVEERGHLDHLDPLDLLDRRDPMDLLETAETQGLLEALAHLALLAHLDHPASLDALDHLAKLPNLERTPTTAHVHADLKQQKKQHFSFLGNDNNDFRVRNFWLCSFGLCYEYFNFFNV
jgi:hypothetical protein